MSILVDRRSATSSSVEQATRRYRARAIDGLLLQTSAFGLDRPRPEPGSGTASLDGPPHMPDFHNFIRFIEEFLQEARRRMVAATEDHDREVGDDRRRRDRRELARVTAYETLTAIRMMLTGAIGPVASQELLGIVGTTPQNVTPLLSRLAHAISKLEKSDRAQFPPLRIDGVAELSWDGTLAKLRAVHDELLDATNAVGEDSRDFDVSLLAKQEAIGKFNQIYVGWTQVFEGLLRAADLSELAVKLRPTIARRPGAGEGGDELPLPEEPLPEEPVPEEPAPDPLPVPEEPDGPPAPDETASLSGSQAPPRPRLVPPNGGGGAA